MDSYAPLAPELTLVIVGLKNIFGFGFGYGIIPWIKRSGYDGAFGALAGIQVAVVVLGMPLMYWGKKVRHITSKWRIVIG
jgi:hypothetical protein